ncbi:UNKNOWN [Stylonychia lemnae]|uniref:Uncharacterized protein n=1 Tax=Stylonychia lemnae TaxID=5949 RepID=A0A078AQP2_STYLE|nr:UNKNOWN [Stylonychia lemnae]|eukprot:CDW84519.1 UNKNOWN [Stylonychia lemnae]
MAPAEVISKILNGSVEKVVVSRDKAIGEMLPSLKLIAETEMYEKMVKIIVH